MMILRENHRDYKRIEAASDDESRDKLNKSNGAPRNFSRGGILKTHNFCQFLLVFMTMMHADIGYNKKICCSFPVFVILGADSQIFV